MADHLCEACRMRVASVRYFPYCFKCGPALSVAKKLSDTDRICASIDAGFAKLCETVERAAIANIMAAVVTSGRTAPGMPESIAWGMWNATAKDSTDAE